jgi:hypothetical protein
VKWGGTTLFDDVNTGQFTWVNRHFVVAATSSSSVLQFGFQNDNGFMALDDVSVTPIPAPSFQSFNLAGSTFSFTWASLANVAYHGRRQQHLQLRHRRQGQTVLSRHAGALTTARM